MACTETFIVTAEQAAIATDIRQIKMLLKQADAAMTKALNDGDLSAEDASMVGNLLKKVAVI